MGPLFRTVQSIQTMLYKILSSLKMWALSILGKTSNSTKQNKKLDGSSASRRAAEQKRRFVVPRIRPVRPPKADPMEIIPGYWDARNLCFIEDEVLEIRTVELTSRDEDPACTTGKPPLLDDHPIGSAGDAGTAVSAARNRKYSASL